MRISFIGDVHGKVQQYQKILRNRFSGQRTFQLGDMGVGFTNAHGHVSAAGGLHKDIMNSGNHKWIRGNHDNPEIARKLTDRGYAGDYGYYEDIGMFYLGGAFSIDYMWRTPGRSWWAEEELSYPELSKAIDFYLEKKPRLVATHEAPTSAAMYLLTQVIPNFRPEKQACGNSRTSVALEQMFRLHMPKEWVFGHYHVSKSFQFLSTKFTCINELDVYTVSDEPLIVVPEKAI